MIRPPRTAAIAIAVAVLVFGVTGAIEAANAGRERRSRDFEQSFGLARLAFTSSVDRAVSAIDSENVAANASEASTRLDLSDGTLSAVAVVGVDGVVPGGNVAPADGGALVPGERLADQPSAATALAIAADAGDVAASAPIAQRDTGAIVLLVAPRYAPGTDRSTVARRRQAIAGYAVGVVDAANLARDAFAPATGARRAIEIHDGAQVLFSVHGRGSSVHPPADASSASLTVGSRTWSVSGWTTGGAGGGPWLILAASIAATIAVLALGAGAATSRARDAAAASASRREFALVLESGALLQRSLELADVLPSFAVTLVDEFDLDGVAVLLSDDAGRLVELFSMGARPALLPPAALALGPQPDTAAPLDEVFVPLHRAGRAIGALWVMPRVGLSHSQLDAIRAIADLAGSAVANAELFRKEQDTARRLRDLDQLKNDFIGTVSHELRTPVTAIKGFSAILESSWDQFDDDQRRDLIARISRNSASLGTLLNGLLDFARLERRSMTLETASLDLTDAVRNVVDQMGSLLEEQHVEVDAREPVVAFTDPQAVERIVSNLLTNAAKYSPAGSRILVEVRSDRNRAVVSVDDEGPGVPADERGRIFSRFYRGTGDAVMRTRGAGIGLAVVQEFADRIGATVSVDGGRAGGARFTVSFPSTDPTADGAPADGLSDARSAR